MTQRIELTGIAELDAEKIAELFESEFEGWCPVCKNVTINYGETICCDCFKTVLEYHVNTCGCYP